MASPKGDTKSPPQPNSDIPKVNEPDTKQGDAIKNENVAEPLAPPPRPGPAQTPDYFSVQHGGHLSNEQNPFEFSFAGGGNSAGGGLQTPGGTKLPSVASLTSPAGAPNLGGGITPNFWGGLRSGPLSPAMLSGPQVKDDYFGDNHHMRGGFPTPNESGMRSGLTPGGSGSMFPEPSPNSAALFNNLVGGGATPGTIDFHRTALSAAAKQQREAHAQTQAQQNITSQPQETMNGLDVKPTNSNRFDQHDANDAANGLYLLAQAHNQGPQPTNGYAMAAQMPVHAHPQNMQMGAPPSETSPHMANRNGGSISTNSGRGVSEMSGYSDENDQQNRPNTRGKGKRKSTQEAPPPNGRRKAEPAAPASKRAKTNGGGMPEPESDQEELDMSKDEYNANGKKMTDEEKRKNFLERNRVAALKCRQRKKQWLANLQQKVEIYTAENDNLSAQLNALREEVVNLKTILMAHKDCPISQQQGLALNMAHIMENNYGGQMNPYGMAMNQPPPQQQFMAAQAGMQRRSS